jgi:hypothetical protein
MEQVMRLRSSTLCQKSSARGARRATPIKTSVSTNVLAAVSTRF